MSHNIDRSKRAKQKLFSPTTWSNATEIVFYDEESGSFDCWPPQKEPSKYQHAEPQNQVQRVLLEVGLVLAGAMIVAVLCTLMA